MRVLHVISSISRSCGGPSRSAQGLVAGLNRADVEAWLMTLHRGDEPWVKGVEHFANGERFEDAAMRVNPQIVHLHGLWNIELHRCALICRRRHVPYVIAPRGMLEPWSLKQKWLKKRIARFLYQDSDLKFAVALHATAESEGAQFKKLGFMNKVIVSPNGVNVPESSFHSLHPSSPANAKRLLFVSRMHPKKGVAELVEAINAINRTQPELLKPWRVELVYTLSGDLEREYEAKVKDKVAAYGLNDKFVFTGALNDDEKWSAYARADLFVLPTYSENFGIVVAEALWAGVPVITTKGTPWHDLEEFKCGWWVEVGVTPLSVALKDAMSLSGCERAEMGLRGHRLVEEKYTWDAVVKKMVDGYEEIVSRQSF